MKLKINKEKADKERIIQNIQNKLYISNCILSFDTLSKLFLYEGGNVGNSKTLQTIQRMVEKISAEKHREILFLNEKLVVKTIFDEFLISFCAIFNSHSEKIKAKYFIQDQFISFKNQSFDEKKETIEIINHITPLVVELWLSMLDSLSKGETPWLKSEYRLDYNGETIKEINAYLYTEKIEISKFNKESEDIIFYKTAEENYAIKFLEEIGTKSIPSKFFQLKDEELSYRKQIKRLNTFKFYKIKCIELNEENPFCYLPQKESKDYLIPIYGKISFNTFCAIFDGLDGYDRLHLSQAVEIYKGTI